MGIIKRTDCTNLPVGMPDETKPLMDLRLKLNLRMKQKHTLHERVIKKWFFTKRFQVLYEIFMLTSKSFSRLPSLWQHRYYLHSIISPNVCRLLTKNSEHSQEEIALLHFKYQHIHFRFQYLTRITMYMYLSAYDMKHNCSLFDRLFKKNNNDILLFGITFFVLEILTFFYYAN